MKQVISITVEPSVADHLKRVGNRSKYIEQLIINDIYQANKDRLEDRVAQAILDNQHVQDYLATLVTNVVEQEIRKAQQGHY